MHALIIHMRIIKDGRRKCTCRPMPQLHCQTVCKLTLGGVVWLFRPHPPHSPLGQSLQHQHVLLPVLHMEPRHDVTLPTGDLVSGSGEQEGRNLNRQIHNHACMYICKQKKIYIAALMRSVASFPGFTPQLASFQHSEKAGEWNLGTKLADKHVQCRSRAT